MKLIKAVEKEDLLKIKDLYEQAFPAEERKDFSLIIKKQEQGVLENLMILGDQDEFAGLAITISYDDMTLLDYFAIAPEYRGAGNGTKALALLKERYKGKKFILEIENPNIEAENKEQRIRRKVFYKRNGMNYIPFLVRIAGVEMEVLTVLPGLKYEQYSKIYEYGYSPEIERYVELLQEYE